MNDTWWGDRGQDWNGQDISYLFYWVITPGGQSLGANYLPQATFTAVRKSLLMTYPRKRLPLFLSHPRHRFPRLTEIRLYRDNLCPPCHVLESVVIGDRPVRLQLIFFANI